MTEVTGPQTPVIPQVRVNIPVFGMSLCSALAMPYRVRDELLHLVTRGVRKRAPTEVTPTHAS